ncbi:Chloroperoxidase [Phascolomyces articulosus]|uniref:Chloroperoxidase n=1 Tax=Phascolomyces articulosus TaxID=60185 RepID=A0AAD5P746_9FUNG|nr:Chloroperoxidase [Phascolomyces articulosus]
MDTKSSSSSSMATTRTAPSTITHRLSTIKKSIKLCVKLSLVGFLIYMIFQMIQIQRHGSEFQVKTQEEWIKLLQQHPYQQPTASDLRGPCPALNTLANHGFLPRDGRNITQPQLFEAAVILGMPPFFAHFVSKLPYTKFKQLHPSDGIHSYLRPLKVVHLGQFGIHNAVEHDVSLSRHDAHLPPFSTIQFIPERFEQMIQLARKRAEQKTKSHSDNTKKKVNNKKKDDQQEQEKGLYIVDKDVYDHRKLCWLESIRDNPYFAMGLTNQLSVTFETVALLEILGHKSIIHEDHLRSFFEEEKIPKDWYPCPPRTLPLFKKIWKSFRGVQKSEATLPRDPPEND